MFYLNLIVDGLSCRKLVVTMSDVVRRCRASLTIDNGIYTASVAMPTGQIQPQDGQLYIGGVPATVDLHRTETPVHTSLVGGVCKITINDR